jgi:uracil-DNA glycosylase family 4
VKDPNCRLCPLGGTVQHTCVWGEWWVDDPDWQGPVAMVIGINPGYQEDQQDRPFVGPSGGLLKEALRQAGVRKAYLTNTFKCLAEPDMEYARACRDYLEEELRDVRPAFILALGNIPTQRLLGKGTVGQVAGKEIWSAKYACWVLPAFHPAAILRNRGREPAWRADILRYGRLVRGELVPPPNTPPVRVDLVSTGHGLEALDRQLRSEPSFSYDFETTVGNWWDTRFQAYTIAFSFSGLDGVVVPIAHPDVDARWAAGVVKWMQHVTPLMRAGDTTRTAHNGMFDDLVWFRVTGQLARPTFDTMLALQLLDENAPKSLKWAGRAHLGWPDWDIDARKYHPLEDLYPYNGYDAAATFLLQELLQDRLREDGILWRYFQALEMPKLRALERLVARGIHVNRQRAAELFLQAIRERNAADARVPVENPASHPQVARWLYEDLKLPVIKTGKKHPSTDEATVKTLGLAYPDARLILACRRPRKKISTYFRPANRYTKHSFDGRFHPEMRTTSVETGRLASFFHTIPRDTSVRPIFSAPPGYILVQADYRQIEARLCAWMAAGRPETWEGVDPRCMLWAFHTGLDIYSDFAGIALHKPITAVTKQERQEMGKVPVLAQLYGMAPEGLRAYAWNVFEILWSEQQATALWRLFRQRYPEFPAWHQFVTARLERRGYTQTPLGRIRRLPDALNGQRDAIRSGINAEPQSLASDITVAAMIGLDRAGLHIVGMIHDALLFQVRVAEAREVLPRIRRGMLQAPVALRAMGLWLPDGLIEVEVSAGPWGLGVEIPDLTSTH